MALLLLLILFLVKPTPSAAQGFIFNGFRGANLTKDGSATITSKGLVHLCYDSHVEASGHAFYPLPVRLKNSSSSSNRTVVSFSTRFVFAITTKMEGAAGHGLAFTLSPNAGVIGGRGIYYLGLLNETNLGNSSNHILAVEFDTNKDQLLNDIDYNHVGIDINTLISNASRTAAYFTQDNQYKTINLQSGSPILCWIDYQSGFNLLSVSIAPINDPIKPRKPLLSVSVDLSPILKDFMYVGFSCGVGKLSSDQFILGWSFNTDGEAAPLDRSRLPPLPKGRISSTMVLIIVGTIAAALIVTVVLFTSGYVLYRRRKKLSDVMEGWELEYPHRFSYRSLYKATKGFREKELLGSGGFGRVYKGVLPGTTTEIAVKRVSHDSRQGLREFVAEISSLGRLRHRNLVQLQGWCRRQEELLLVYDFMPNGNLDSLLFDDRKAKHLDWEQRFRILKGIADGLLYLHEGWEQVVVHRDVKASNVLLDGEMNGRLGDFGLARLHEHGQNPQTTRVVGTLGYMAPELSRTGKATASADVFSYGALLLEVASGKRPIHAFLSTNETEGKEEEDVELVLSEWVLKWWKKGEITGAMDERLEGRYVKEEAELVLKLGVLCLQAVPEKRPTMRQVAQYLEDEALIPQSLGMSMRVDSGLGSGLDLDSRELVLHEDLGFDQLGLPSSGPPWNSTGSL